MNASGSFLLALWLIGQSVQQLFNLKLPYSSIVLPVIALSAALLLIGPVLKFRKDLGIALLCMWLILSAAMQLLHFSFSHSSVILAIISLFAGFFLIIRK